MFWIVLFGIVYLIGIYASVDCDTMENVEHHDGGFLNMGYTTSSNRDATPKDIRLALIWPLRGLWWFIRTTLWLVNEDVIHYIGLIFGFNYRDTNICRKISRFLN
jgi:hypothetical protein